MPGPLASLKVLDFTTLLPGPYATMVLADLGADVVRVEAPHRPDLMRLAPPFDGDVSAGHALVNRSKRSVALDLKHPEAAGVVRRLVRGYDVVLEGFRPGVMDRLGVGYAALSAVNPRLIYGSITGYGQTGPHAQRAGHDLNYLALSGVMSYTGRAGQGPAPLGLQVADVGGAMGAVAGLLAAVVHRYETGQGQHLDLSLLDAAIALSAFPASRYLAAGQQPGYETDPLAGGSFYDFYQTLDGRYLAVGSLEPRFWQGFCEVLGRPDLIERGLNVWDPETQRCLKAELRETIAGRTLAAWMDRFAGQDVCVEPVLTLEEMAAHPQVDARQMIVEVPRADGTAQRQVASPFRFSKTAPAYAHIGLPLGAHTEAVLAEAGFSRREIDALRAGGALGEDAPSRPRLSDA